MPKGIFKPGRGRHDGRAGRKPIDDSLRIYKVLSANPKRPAIVSVAQNISWTYEYVDAESNRLANWLQQNGVTPGMTVGMFLPRSAQVHDLGPSDLFHLLYK